MKKIIIASIIVALFSSNGFATGTKINKQFYASPNTVKNGCTDKDTSIYALGLTVPFFEAPYNYEATCIKSKSNAAYFTWSITRVEKSIYNADIFDNGLCKDSYFHNYPLGTVILETIGKRIFTYTCARVTQDDKVYWKTTTKYINP
jgi:hypothetical protein